MTKQPTKEDIVELEEKSKLFLIMTCNYPEAPLSFEQAEKIYKALIQAGVIVDTKSSTINDELPGKPDENKTTGIPGAEPKTIWVCEECNTTFKTKQSFDEHQNADYAQCLKKPILYFPQQDFNSLQAQYTQALRRIAKLQDALIHIKEYWNGANESAVDAILEAMQTSDEALTTDDAGEE